METGYPPLGSTNLFAWDIHLNNLVEPLEATKAWGYARG